MNENCFACKEEKCGIFGKPCNKTCHCSFYATPEIVHIKRKTAQNRLNQLGLEATDFVVDGATYHGTGTFNTMFANATA